MWSEQAKWYHIYCQKQSATQYVHQLWGLTVLHKHTTFVPIMEGTLLLYSVLLNTNTGITNILFPSEGTAPSASMQPLYGNWLSVAHLIVAEQPAFLAGFELDSSESTFLISLNKVETSLMLSCKCLVEFFKAWLLTSVQTWCLSPLNLYGSP